MADSKEHSSDKTTYRTEWNPDDAPPQYNMAPASNPFRSPSPATHANRGFDTSYRNGEPDAAAYQYMPPVDPPPPSSSSSSGAYADMPKPGYGYDQSPYQGEGSSSSAGMYRSPSSSSAYMAAPSSEAYARGQTGPSLGPAPSAQPGFGSGGRGLLGIRGSGGFGLRDMLATNRSDNPTGTSGGGRAGLMGTRGGGRAGLMGMLANAGADSSRDVLSTPPPSFSRAPQPQFPYSPFPPLVVLSLDKSLAHGFPTIPPASHVQPHPFMAHDVNEDDWTQFLRNIHQVGTTTSPMSNVGRSGIVGTLVSMGTDAVMGGDKSGPATQIVEHWNAYFFHPRLMEVNLIHGPRVYTNSGRLPPDILQHGYSRAGGGSNSDSDSSSDSDSGFDNQGGSRREQRRARKQARRAERRARKEEKRAKKRGSKSNRGPGGDTINEPWKLVITFRPAAM